MQNRREALFSGVLVFGVASFSLALTYRAAEQQLREGIRRHLRNTAQVTAAAIDPALHRSIRSPMQMGSAAYRRASEPLLVARRAVPGLTYAYTLAGTPGAPRFVLDSSFFIRNRGDQTAVARPGELYREAPAEARRALGQGVVTVGKQPYSDQWGTFISSYAPFRGPDGRVAGVVGVDLSVATLEAQLLPLRQSLALGLALSAGLASLVGLGQWRSLQALTRAAGERARARELAEVAATAANSASRAKSAFLSAMGEEIRSPLNGVLGLCTIVLSTPLSEHQRECLLTVKRSGEALLALLADILDFARIEEQGPSLQMRRFELRPLLEEVQDLQAAAAHGKGIELALLLAPDVPETVVTDSMRLRQILLNLLSNAVKFSEHGEVVTSVALHEPEGGGSAELEIRVRDSGCGITAADRELVFRPFTQLDSSSRRLQGGSGLGLAICRSLASALGGSLGVESAVGEGSCFHLRLPLESGGSVERLPPAGETVGADPLAGRSLLLVGSKGSNHTLLESLAALWGMEVAWAEDEGSLRQLLEREAFDGVLIDAPLPALDPYEVVRLIRSHPRGKALPLLLYVRLGMVDPGGGEAGRELAAVLRKPIKPAPLKQALAGALRQPLRPQPEPGRS